jgi:hypothetical protein
VASPDLALCATDLSQQIFIQNFLCIVHCELRVSLRDFTVNFPSGFSLRILITSPTIAHCRKIPFSPPKLVFNLIIVLSSQPIFCKPAEGTIEAGQRSPVTIVFNPDRPGCRYEAQLLVEVRRFRPRCLLSCFSYLGCFFLLVTFFSRFASTPIGRPLRSADPLRGKAPEIF